MKRPEDYDALIASIYAAGLEGRPMAPAIDRLRLLFDGAAAGLSIYDLGGVSITHTLTSTAADAGELAAQAIERLRALNDDPGAQIVTRTRFGDARRFTDLIPRARLANSRWFQTMSTLSGVGFGMAMDLMIDELRVRLFVMAAIERDDFSRENAEWLTRIGHHIARAFKGQVHRMAPAAEREALGSFTYPTIEAAPHFRDDRLARHLRTRYALSAAEAKVAVAAASGRARQDAAATLGIGLNTYKTHLRRIYAKTGVRRAGALVNLLNAANAGFS